MLQCIWLDYKQHQERIILLRRSVWLHNFQSQIFRRRYTCQAQPETPHDHQVFSSYHPKLHSCKIYDRSYVNFPHTKLHMLGSYYKLLIAIKPRDKYNFRVTFLLSYIKQKKNLTRKTKTFWRPLTSIATNTELLSNTGWWRWWWYNDQDSDVRVPKFAA
jgi:hypothetical protein